MNKLIATTSTFVLLLIATSILTACGAGVPVKLRIDEFDFDVDVDSAVNGAESQLQSQGLLLPGISSIPPIWPESLPDIRYTVAIESPSQTVDLTPAEGTKEAKKYEKINKVKEAIERVEFNDLILRVERSSLTTALPDLFLQIAPEPDANPDDPEAWRTIGMIPGAEPGFVGDVPMLFVEGGESMLNNQLSDEKKEFALRARGQFTIDTEENPRRPQGKATLRFIVQATFFVSPENSF